MGKGGKGKGKITKVWTAPKKWEPKGKSRGKADGRGGGQWIWVDEAPKVYKTKGKGKGKGGKAKGKGKRRAAPLTSEFWTKKVEAEGRKEIGETVLPGVISRYNVKQGYGFLNPDNPQGLPNPVKKKMNEAEAAVEAEGKEVKEKGLLYFRKPDVNHEEGCQERLGMPFSRVMGKGGKGKGARVTKVWTAAKKWEPKGKSKGKADGRGGGQWVWVDEAPKVYKTKGKGKGKGVKGGKAKGKGKRRAAPLTSEFWNKKVEAEGRKEVGETVLPGVISRYSVKQGYGFIRPDSPQGLPKAVKKKMNEAEAAAEAEGKEVKEKGLLYFRKPDVNHQEGFKLTDGTPVTFRLYVDNLGAGALDVSMA